MGNLEIIEFSTTDLGLAHIKLVKSPISGIPALDVMWKQGLRLTVDLREQAKISSICKHLNAQISSCRPSSQEQYHDSMAALERIIDKVFGENGRIKIIDFDRKSEIIKELQSRWEESLFLTWMKKQNFINKYPFEMVIEAVLSLYESSEINSGLNIGVMINGAAFTNDDGTR